jgi:hypothetical protein
MIKKFDEFKINELKWSTYRSAAEKLKKLGGRHKDRAKDLTRHTYIMGGRHLGLFNVNCDIVRKLSMNYITRQHEKMNFVVLSDRKDAGLNEEILKQAPLPVYITGSMWVNVKESFSDDDLVSCSGLDFMFFAIPEDESIEDTFEMFMLTIPIKWISDEQFVLSDHPNSFFEMDLGIVKFSDRKSAIKFRNQLLSQENLKDHLDGYQNLREFFMEFSQADQWEKLFEKMKKININQLYN